MPRNRSNSEPLPKTNPLSLHQRSESISTSGNNEDIDESPFERSANGLYFVDKQNRQVLYSLKSASNPAPVELYECSEVTLKGIGSVYCWRPRVRLITNLEMAEKKDDLIHATYQYLFHDEKYIIMHNDCAEFARFLQGSMLDSDINTNSNGEVSNGTQVSHNYSKDALGMYGESTASCGYHSVSVVAIDGVDFVALEAHAGIKTLKRPTFHIRKGVEGFMHDNDRVLDTNGKPTKKSRGIGKNNTITHLKDANHKMIGHISKDWNVYGDKKIPFKSLEEYIQGLLILGATESQEDIYRFVKLILAQKSLWNKDTKYVSTPDGVSKMQKESTLESVIKIALDKTKKITSRRSITTQNFYASLVKIGQLLSIRQQLEKEKVKVDPSMLSALYSISGSLDDFFKANSFSIPSDKQRKAESKAKKTINSTSGLGNNCLIYSILQGANIANNHPSHDQIAQSIRLELVNRGQATDTSFLVNDQGILDTIFGYLNREGLLTQGVNIHFISVNGDNATDDDQTWRRGGSGGMDLYIYNDSNVHFSAML